MLRGICDDYGLCFYDPAIGRFTSVDPLADQMPEYTPYHMSFNNPMRYVDPDGLMPIDPMKKARELRDKFEEAKAAAVEIYNSAKQGVKDGFNSFIDFFGQSEVSDGAGLVETFSDGALNEVAKNLSRASDVVSVADGLLSTDFSDSEQTEEFTQNTVLTGLSTIPLVGPPVSITGNILKDNPDLSGNLNNEKMSGAFLTSLNANKGAVNARVSQRQLDAERRIANYTPEQNRIMQLRIWRNQKKK